MDKGDYFAIEPQFDRRTSEEINKSSDVGDPSVPVAALSEGADNSRVSVMPPHPYAGMFPRMHGADFTALVASIKKDGLEEPIVKYEGKILDGRNRYAACTEADVAPKFVEYEGSDPQEFVLRKNLHRRHLITSQRSMVAAKMTDMNQGERTDLQPSANLQKVSVAKAAEIFNVSPRSVETAKSVLASGNEELIEAVESGKLSVSAAAKRIAEPSIPVVILPEGEQQSEKLLRLWAKTGDEGRTLFLEAIGVTT